MINAARNGLFRDVKIGNEPADGESGKNGHGL